MCRRTWSPRECRLVHKVTVSLDGPSGCPGEKANGPGAGGSRVNHILVQLDEEGLEQAQGPSNQALGQCGQQPAQSGMSRSSCCTSCGHAGVMLMDASQG